MALAERIEARLAIVDDPLPGRADAIIGLGYGIAPNGTASSQSKAVVEEMLVLGENLQAKALIFCGGFGSPTEAHTMHAYACDIAPTGHEGRLLILETASLRTWENTEQVLGIMRRFNFRTAVVVAHQWHARRVRATFRKTASCTENGECRIAVTKVFAPYHMPNILRRFHSFWNFLLWDTGAFFLSKLKGYC